jgi:metal transporter CNNM
MHAHD